MTSPLRFSLLLLVFSFVLGASAFALQYATQVFTSPNWVIASAFIYFYFLFILVYTVSAYGLKKNQQVFTTMTVGGIAMKFLFSLGFILIYLIFSSKVDKAYVIMTLIMYLFYSVFEIYFLLTNLRHISTKK